jgi:putative ABC transport system ATP-binding protein
MLELVAVEKRFGNTPILNGVNLRIEAGKSAALVGESGSGKSTLLNIIAGLEPFNAGSVIVAGIDLSRANASLKSQLRSLHLGFVFQAFHLMPHLSALQNVMLPLLLQQKPEASSKAAALITLESLGLASRADALPSKLSGGEQQRVALARAIVHKPSLVLADEPTGNLDPRNAEIALALLLASVKDSGAALLLVTHSDKVAAQADICVHLSNGKLV